MPTGRSSCPTRPTTFRKSGRGRQSPSSQGSSPDAVGASAVDLDDLYRLLAIAKYDERYVIPPAHHEDAGRLLSQHEQLFCSLDTPGGPGMGGQGPPGVEQFHGGASPGGSHQFHDDAGRQRFNLFGWNGEGPAPGLFPEELAP